MLFSPSKENFKNAKIYGVSGSKISVNKILKIYRNERILWLNDLRSLSYFLYDESRDEILYVVKFRKDSDIEQPRDAVYKHNVASVFHCPHNVKAIPLQYA